MSVTSACVTREFVDTQGWTHRGALVIEGPKGLIIGHNYRYIYRLDPATGRYAFHSHGYVGWEHDNEYFRSIVGLN